MTTKKVTCGTHGEACEAYVCEHLVGASGLQWHSHEPSDENPWPDAWCGKCHTAFQREGEWNETSGVGVNIKLICHQCYERTKAKCSAHYITPTLARLTLTDEIASAIRELKLESRIRLLPPAEAERAIYAVQETFVAEPTAIWWWDSLKPELSVVSTSPANQSYRFLPTVCPDIEAWLLASDDEAPPWPVFAGTPSALSAVIGACRHFEYAIVSPSQDWIIFENHHNILVAAGEPVASRLQQIAG